jgi:hypothetical protein
MKATELASLASRSFAERPAKPLQEIVSALVPRQLARSLVVPLVIFWVAATVALAFDRGYAVDLAGLLMVLVCRASYRAGVREGECREAFRRQHREYVELRRRVLGN